MINILLGVLMTLFVVIFIASESDNGNKGAFFCGGLMGFLIGTLAVLQLIP